MIVSDSGLSFFFDADSGLNSIYEAIVTLLLPT